MNVCLRREEVEGWEEGHVGLPWLSDHKEGQRKRLFLCFMCYNLTSIEMSTFGKREPVTVLELIRSVLSQGRTKQEVKREFLKACS